MQLTVIENNGVRVLTSQQLADAYGTTTKRIADNFSYNKDKYIEGKHYVCLKGSQLKEFLQSRNSGLQNIEKTRSLYLWTEKGVLLHSKSLNTAKAWEVYDYLVDFYFRAKEQEVAPVQKPKRIKSTSAAVELVVDAPQNEVIQEAIKVMRDNSTMLNTLLTATSQYYVDKSLYDVLRHFIIQTTYNLLSDLDKFRKAEPNMIPKS